MENGLRKKYTGRCMCGAVTYEVQGPPIIVAQCHCDECRRISGTGHTIGAMFPSESLILNGKLGKFKYISIKGSEVTKGFCPSCGSPIFGTNTQSPNHVTLSLGTMDDTAGLAIQVVIFTRDKRHWDQLDDGVTSFETQPDWQPEV